MRYKKLTSFVSVCLWSCASVFAQQHPHYTMYMANNFILNPAVAGIEPYIDLKIAGRSQWTGFQDAPRTMYATLNAPGSVANFGNNRLGFGGKVFMDKSGPVTMSAAEANFAYHLPIDRRYKLSFGMGAGFVNQQVDLNNVQFEDPNDPIYSTARFSRISPTINAGLWFYSKDMFVGLAAQNLIEQDRSIGSTVVGDNGLGLYRHYFATAGYRFELDDFYITPSAMLKFVSPAPMSFDINLKAQFQDRFWAGVTWRRHDGVAAMLGLFITQSLNMAYSYDFIRSDIRRQSLGSHEIIIGININNEWGPRCPTIAW